MSSNPYENEPGFENANTSEDKKAQAQYATKVRNVSQARLESILVPNSS